MSAIGDRRIPFDKPIRLSTRRTVVYGEHLAAAQLTKCHDDAALCRLGHIGTPGAAWSFANQGVRPFLDRLVED